MSLKPNDNHAVLIGQNGEKIIFIFLEVNQLVN
jgi:hypothetical protein